MRVLNILKETMADGPGLRDSVYVAGCMHHCPGCHNPESWDMKGGNELSINEILDELDNEFTNITISGGDPFYQPEEFLELLKGIRKRYPNKTIWVYTGYTIEELNNLANTNSVFSNILINIDVLVDGPFILNKRDTSLLYRGSNNQHIYKLNSGIILKDITNDPNGF